MRRPLCFVLMPFGKKRNPRSGALVDFEDVYDHLIRPAVEQAGLRPHRADEELQGGIFHKRMFERLAFAEYAVADLSHANANVFYELGIRHACRPWSTVLLFQKGQPLPLDVALDAALAYPVDLTSNRDGCERLRAQLLRRLLAAQEHSTDSPVFQLVAGLPTPEVDHRRVDAMLEGIDHERAETRRVERARALDVGALREVEHSLGDVQALDAEISVSLLLAYRAHEAWTDMVRLVDRMTPLLAEALVVQEQYALALSRNGDTDRAEEILKAILARRPSSETYGLLGGVHKRRWLRYRESGGSLIKADGLLEIAERTYLDGFEHDPRDPYPGVNAVAMRAIRGPHDREFLELLHVVRYATRRRLDMPDTDYWDHACELELAVIAGDREGASRALRGVLARATDHFETHTTLTDLGLLREFCRARGDLEWLDELSRELEAADEHIG